MSDFDQQKLEQLQGKVLADVTGAIGTLLCYMGDQSGVYDVLDAAGPCTAETLADKAGIDARYAREWLSANAAAGYVSYNPDDETFWLSPEQALIFAREGQPMNMQGFFQAVVGQYETHEKAIDVFKSGAGRPWGEHSSCCFCGTDRFFRPGYAANLVEHWLPALDGVVDRLTAGGTVADVGCGRGSSTVLLAEAFPQSQVHGFDFHEASIEDARAKAAEAGLNNVRFEVAKAKEFNSGPYDLICVFDALHDMGDPVGAAAHMREALKPDGRLMLVEPLAGDTLKENLHLLGALFYSFSTIVCTPASKAQEVGLALGAQAGQKRLTEVLTQAGFSSVRRATETPTNMVLEARP
ncbi:MAG: class I SAM-dependent methyltransferase [Rhodothalassiaceae bacterium]